MVRYCLELDLMRAILPQTSQLSVNSCAIDESVTPLGSSPSFLVWSQSLIVIITLWFAIALDEIRTRRILRETADCLFLKHSRTERSKVFCEYLLKKMIGQVGQFC